jgi:hypothetical protein
MRKETTWGARMLALSPKMMRMRRSTTRRLLERRMGKVKSASVRSEVTRRMRVPALGREKKGVGRSTVRGVEKMKRVGEMEWSWMSRKSISNVFLP